MSNSAIDFFSIWARLELKITNSGRGRKSTTNSKSAIGIIKIRELIVDLAVRGKLVPQDPNEEPASKLLEKIAFEKDRLIKDGIIKKSKPMPKITREEKPFGIPEGWKWARLGSVGNIYNGNSVSVSIKEEKYTNIKEGLPFIATKDIGYGWEEPDYYNGISIPKDEKKFKVAHKNSVFICAEGGSAGKKCGITLQDVCFGNKLYANELFGNIEADFILANYLSPTFYHAFSDKMTGIIGGISTIKFNRLLVPIPPLVEQRRIVAKIDELMALCDQLEKEQSESSELHEILVKTLLATLTEAKSPADLAEAWERVESHFDLLFKTIESVDELRKTVLQLAVQGKLVPQDPNDEPASELLKRIKAEKEMLVKEGKIKKQKLISEINKSHIPFELPCGWECTSLGTALKKITDGTHHSPPNSEIGDYLYISAKNIKESGVLVSNATYVSKEVHEEIFSRCDPAPGDILYIKDGATTGVAVINDLEEPFSMLSSVALLKVPVGILNTFLLISLTSPYFYNEMRSGMTGVAITRVTLTKLNHALMPLPPLAEQHRIVKIVDKLMKLCDQLDKQIREKQKTAEQFMEVAVREAVEG